MSASEAMTQRLQDRIAAIMPTAIGAFAGLLNAWAILAPLGQCLIDLDDDHVVLHTIRYFKYAAVVVCAIFCLIGALAGRSFFRLAYPVDQQSN